jgi:hypothetical protein
MNAIPLSALSTDDIRRRNRQIKAEEQRAERDRIFALLSPVPVVEGEDLGQDLGPAMQARPSKVVCLEGRAVSTVARGQSVQTRRMTVECVLDGLLNAGQITDPEWRAGWMFRRAWQTVVRMPKVTATYCAATGGGMGDVDSALARREQANADLREAYKALGLMRSAVINAVCGMDEKATGRVKELKVSLAILVQHYKVPADYERFQTRGR